MKTPLNQIIHILLIEKNPLARIHFKQSVAKVQWKTKLTIVDTLEKGQDYLAKKTYHILFLNQDLLEPSNLDSLLDSLDEIGKKNTRIPILIISDKDDNTEYMDHVVEKKICRIERTFLTPRGLEYIIPSAMDYAHIKQKNDMLEHNIAPMMDHLPMFVFFVDQEGIIKYVRGKSLEKLNLSKQQRFEQKSIYKISRNYPDFANHIKLALSGTKIEGIDLHIKGITFDVSCIPITNPEGQVEGVFGVAKDCTKRASDQETLLKAKEDTDRNALLKEQFSANISHELRTPMNAIIGFSTLLTKEKLTPLQSLYVKSIKQSSENLLTIINGILDFSKISAKKLKIRKAPFNLIESVKSLEMMLKFQLNTAGLNLIVNIDKNVPKHVVGDSVRISQILINLLSNAIKFTKKGTIYLLVSVKKENNKKATVLFQVKDPGIGLSPSEQKKIFERFTQIEEKSIPQHGAGGTGLGLAITKYLVKLQKGSLTVKSKKNKGSTFSVELPLDVYALSSLRKKNKDYSSINNTSFLAEKKVLLVEDNHLNQLLAETHLKSWNMRVDTVENGLLAVEKTYETLYDIVLMDIQMPVLNGIESTRMIRRNYTAKDLPIVAMTAHALPAEKKKCKEAGMNDYITKPYDVDKTKTLIIRLLKQKIKTTTSPLSPKTHGIKNKKKANICNLRAFESIVKGDLQLREQLIHMYFDAADAVKKTLPLQYKRKNFTELRSILHKFLSSSETFGIKKLSKLITKILDQDNEKKIAKLNMDKLISEILHLITVSQSELKIRNIIGAPTLSSTDS